MIQRKKASPPNSTRKALTIKEKCINWTLSQFQERDREKIFVKQRSEKGSACRIYKELLQLAIKKTISKKREGFNRHFTKHDTYGQSTHRRMQKAVTQQGNANQSPETLLHALWNGPN